MELKELYERFKKRQEFNAQALNDMLGIFEMIENITNESIIIISKRNIRCKWSYYDNGTWAERDTRIDSYPKVVIQYTGSKCQLIEYYSSTVKRPITYDDISFLDLDDVVSALDDLFGQLEMITKDTKSGQILNLLRKVCSMELK